MSSKPVLPLFLVLLMICWADSRRSERPITSHEGEGSNRSGKLFNLFSIIRFSNVPCQGLFRNGTCYTREECQARGGIGETICANGFGTCCIFERSCGSSSNENCTYFTSPSTFPANQPCTLTICPCVSNICQLRLDFMTFIITGPSTDTSEAGSELFGNPSSNGQPFSNAGRCLTDTFTATNPGGFAPPVICGYNSNEHMYVEVSKQCNDLTFEFGATASGTNLVDRKFDIKVTQYSCNYNNLAPKGCTQWYFGSRVGMVQTYNYNNYHLANQKQNICVRREQGLCRICWAAFSSLDFGISGAAGRNGIISPSLCCQYGNEGKNSMGYDCAIIRGVKNFLNTPTPNRFCGRNNGLLTNFNPFGPSTVCTVDTTFMVTFISDATETLVENMEKNIGFKLGYAMFETQCI